MVTLLVLELEVPQGTDLWGELASGWPAYLGYGVSFSFVGGAWIAHSTLTRFIRAADPVLMRLNLVLLLLVSLLPFTTKLMATHLTDSGEGAAVLVLQAVATAVALVVPVAAVLIFLAISVLLLVDALFRAHRRRLRAARLR